MLITPKNAACVRDEYLLQLNLTFDCNLCCSYCYNKDQLNTKPSMPLYMLKRIVGNVEKVLKDNPVEIHLLGGEPTLYSKLIDAIDLFINSKLNLSYVKLFTNGLLINSFKDALSAYNPELFKVDISYHAEQVGDDKFISIFDSFKNSTMNYVVPILLHPNHMDRINKVVDYFNSIGFKDYHYLAIDDNVESANLYKAVVGENSNKLVLKVTEDDVVYYIEDVDAIPDGLFHNLNCGFRKKRWVINPDGFIHSNCCFENDKKCNGLFLNQVKSLYDTLNKDSKCSNKTCGYYQSNFYIKCSGDDCD